MTVVLKTWWLCFSTPSDAGMVDLTFDFDFGFYYWKQKFRTLAWRSIGSNANWFELTGFGLESNLAGDLRITQICWVLFFSTELWWRMLHRRSFRTLLYSCICAFPKFNILQSRISFYGQTVTVRINPQVRCTYPSLALFLVCTCGSACFAVCVVLVSFIMWAGLWSAAKTVVLRLTKFSLPEESLCHNPRAHKASSKANSLFLKK